MATMRDKNPPADGQIGLCSAPPQHCRCLFVDLLWLCAKWALSLCAASVLSKQKSTECILLTVQEVGEAGWLAEFRWVLLVPFHPASVCVSVIQCVNQHIPSLHICEHMALGGKHKCQVFPLNKAEETIIYWPPAALPALCGL